MNIPQVFKNNVRWSFAGSMGSAVLQLLQTIVFARFAGAEQAGDYALAATVMALLTPLAEAGMGQAVVQARDVKPAQIAALVWVNMALGVFIFAFLYGFSPYFAQYFGRPDVASLLLLMGVVLLFTPVGAQCGALLVRNMRFDHSARVEWVATMVGFVTVAVLAVAGWGAWSMAWGFVLKNLFATVGVWYYARSLTTIAWRQPASLHEVAGLLRFGAYDLSARMADAASNYADKLVVGKLLGATALGYYNLAFSLYMIPTARFGAIATRAAFPIFARLSDDKPRLQVFFDQTNRLLILTLTPVFVGVSLFSGEIIRLLYGPEWWPAAPLLSIMAWAGLIRTLSAAMPQLSAGVGKPQRQLLFMTLWAGAFNLVLWGLLQVRPELTAAAWARIAAKLVFELPLLFLLARWCGVRLIRSFVFLCKVVAVFMPIGILTISLSERINDNGLSVIVKLCVWCVSIFVLYWQAGWWRECFYYIRKNEPEA